MALSPQWLDELRARTTLSTLIMRTDKLQKAGREWKGCCPFHSEKTPSFTVSDEKGFYHCFGCGAHGDAISWMTDQRGMSFMDAVKELAAEAGMEVPAPDPQAAKRAEKRAELVDVTAAAQDFFVQSLTAADGKKARDYLSARGFSPQIIREFGFGYAPDNKQALPGALSSFDEAMLVESGMRIQTDDGTRYDRFRDRLTLPIQDARGRVIAFGGRILSDSPGAPKYLNSPDTPLFDKGRTLYNLHRASAASRQSDRLIVVEGYMDVIALADAGIHDAVAPLGTALTEQQLQMLWRQVDVPVLCFDGDSAGERAAKRAISRALPMLQPGKSLAFVQLPPGQDPDDLIRERGAAAMKALLATPSTMVDAIWQAERSARPLDTPEQKADLKARLAEHIDAIEHPDIKPHYRRHLFDLYFAFAFPKRLGGFKPGAGFTEKLDPRHYASLFSYVSGGARDQLSHNVLAGFAMHPHLIVKYYDDLWKARPHDDNFAQGLEVLDFAYSEIAAGKAAPDILQKLVSLVPNRTLPFLSTEASEEQAEECLRTALRLLIERPYLERALTDATAQYSREMTEDSLAAQQKAREAKQQLMDDISAFWQRWSITPEE